MSFEDLATWKIEDPDGKLKVSKRRVVWTRADRTSVRCIYRDLDEGIGDFEHSFKVRVDEAYVEDGLNRGLIRFWECRNDWESRIWIYGRRTLDDEGKWTVHLEQRRDGEDIWAYHGNHGLDIGENYRVLIRRKGGVCRLLVYSDTVHDAPLEDSGDIRCDDTDYGSIWLVSTITSRRNRGNWSSGSIGEVVIGRL